MQIKTWLLNIVRYYFINPFGCQFSVLFYGDRVMGTPITFSQSSTYSDLVDAIDSLTYQASSATQWDTAGSLAYVSSVLFADPQYRNQSSAVVMLALAET